MKTIPFYQALLIASILWVVVFGWSVIALIALRNHILNNKRKTFIHRHHGKIHRFNADTLFNSIVCILKDYEGRYRVGNTLYQLDRVDGFTSIQRVTGGNIDTIAAIQEETRQMFYLVDKPFAVLKQIHYSISNGVEKVEVVG